MYIYLLLSQVPEAAHRRVEHLRRAAGRGGPDEGVQGAGSVSNGYNTTNSDNKNNSNDSNNSNSSNNDSQ